MAAASMAATSVLSVGAAAGGGALGRVSKQSQFLAMSAALAVPGVPPELLALVDGLRWALMSGDKLQRVNFLGRPSEEAAPPPAEPTARRRLLAKVGAGFGEEAGPRPAWDALQEAQRRQPAQPVSRLLDLTIQRLEEERQGELAWLEQRALGPDAASGRFAFKSSRSAAAPNRRLTQAGDPATEAYVAAISNEYYTGEGSNSTRGEVIRVAPPPPPPPPYEGIGQLLVTFLASLVVLAAVLLLHLAAVKLYQALRPGRRLPDKLVFPRVELQVGMMLVTLLIYQAAHLAASPQRHDRIAGWLTLAAMAGPLPLYLAFITYRDLQRHPKIQFLPLAQLDREDADLLALGPSPVVVREARKDSVAGLYSPAKDAPPGSPNTGTGAVGALEKYKRFAAAMGSYGDTVGQEAFAQRRQDEPRYEAQQAAAFRPARSEASPGKAVPESAGSPVEGSCSTASGHSPSSFSGTPGQFPASFTGSPGGGLRPLAKVPPAAGGGRAPPPPPAMRAPTESILSVADDEGIPELALAPRSFTAKGRASRRVVPSNDDDEPGPVAEGVGPLPVPPLDFARGRTATGESALQTDALLVGGTEDSEAVAGSPGPLALVCPDAVWRGRFGFLFEDYLGRQPTAAAARARRPLILWTWVGQATILCLIAFVFGYFSWEARSVTQVALLFVLMALQWLHLLVVRPIALVPLALVTTLSITCELLLLLGALLLVLGAGDEQQLGSLMLYCAMIDMTSLALYEGFRLARLLGKGLRKGLRQWLGERDVLDTRGLLQQQSSECQEAASGPKRAETT